MANNTNVNEGGGPVRFREPNYDTSRIGPSLGYVRRGGEHGLSGYDWLWMLDFADRAFAIAAGASADARAWEEPRER